MDSPLGWDYDHRAFSKTQKFLKGIENIYGKPPTSDEEILCKELVVNTPYWKKMEEADQTDKNKASEQLNELSFYPQEWPIERYHRAAAALIGAKAGLTQSLDKVVRHQDYSLCHLLLKVGADPNGCGDTPPLYFVKTTFLAQLFLHCKANVHAKNRWYKKNLLHEVAGHNDYEPELIPMYRSAGVSPLEVDEFGESPLHNLLFALDNYGLDSKSEIVIKKACYLLEGLTPIQTLNLLNYCGGQWLLTVLEKLKNKIEESPESSFRNTRKKREYKALYDYLLEQENTAKSRGKFSCCECVDYVSRPHRRSIEFFEIK